MAHPVSTVDRLPEVERKKVLDAILAGETLSSLAARLGITRQAMSSYKNRVILPAIKTASEIQDVRRRARDSSNDPTPTYASPKDQAIAQATENKVLTREIVKASPLMERHQFLWEKTQDGINSASDSKDLAALPALLNQGHKSIELLGKITGELTEKDAVNLNIIIAIPDTETRQVNTSDNGCYDMQLD